MNSLLHNVRYGLRQLRRNPGFTAIVIVTLAMSIGANTAIFSIVNALLLKSLPYSHPERIGTIYTRMRGSRISDERHHIDGEQWELLRDDVPALISAISNIRPQGVNLETNSHAQYVRAGRVSAHYLDVLQIHPILGRNFVGTEDMPGGPKTAILSYNVWHNSFASDRNILGQAILLKGEPYTVIGVLPPDVTTPLSADIYTAIQGSRAGEGAGTNFECITRLRDGATWQEADAQINRAWGSRPQRYELQDDPSGEISYYSVPLQQGETDPLRAQVLALMLAAGFILLIACANLAGLTLVRVLRRTQEMSTRLALGASQWQIQKQLWAENLVLAIAGGTVGIIVGFLALRGLLLLLPQYFLPVSDVHLDARVLAFTIAVSLFTSLLFGMLPALTPRRFDLRSAIANRGATGGDRLHLRQVLIASEVALTIVLLAAAGLLVRTLIHLETLPPGFNPDGVITARASLDTVRYHDPAAFRKLLDESIAAMRQIPGVQAAAVGLGLPYERTVIEGGIAISDGKEAGDKAVSSMAYVTPDYFAALQIPLISGRYFTESDGPKTQKVAIINQTFVRKFFHGENPVGRHLFEDTVVVGVVEDVAMAPGIDASAPVTAEQTVYVPASQVAAGMISFIHLWFQPSWIVRTSRPIEGLTAQMQRALASVDPDLPFSGFYRMKDLLAKTLATERVEVALLSTMAALALILSGVGIFGLVANMVTQKTREIGIRMALGSTIHEAIVHIGVPGVRASAIGLVVGLGLCAGALRLMQSVLYGVGVYDTAAIASAVLMLAAVALIAATIPTLRIARIDPARTLRDE
jgi:predicted permease